MTRYVLILLCAWFLAACIPQGRDVNQPKPTQETKLKGKIQDDSFEFTVPGGWAAYKKPLDTDNANSGYKRLNLSVLYEVKGSTFTPHLVITKRSIPSNSTIQNEIELTYNNISPRIRNRTDSTAEVDKNPAVLIRYDQPWGEPWYTFEDTWVERDGTAFVISCWAPLDPTDKELSRCHSLIASLTFK